MDDVTYVRTGDTHIAYRVLGEPDGVDVIMVAGGLFPLEMLAEERVALRFTAGLASIGRLVVFDKRGIGLSDPITDWSRSMQEQWAEDLCAVIEASCSSRPAVVSWETLGVARLAASQRPDLFGSLVLVNPNRFTSEWAVGMTAPAGERLPKRSAEEIMFPSRAGDSEFWAWLSRAGRSGASPTTAQRMWAHLMDHPESLTPADIGVRTLVLHNRDSVNPAEVVRGVAEEIPNSSFVQVDGADTHPVAGDVDSLVTEISQFVTGAPSELTPHRMLSAVLFTDLVESTQRAVDEGDDRWSGLLDVHDQAVERCVRHHGGRVVKYTGDGVLALLPSATSALETVEAIRERLAEAELHIRAGVHVGDVDVRGDDVSGIAVNVAARIMGRANSGETLVSAAVRESSLGSDLRFDEVGSVQLKGIPEAFTLHRCLS